MLTGNQSVDLALVTIGSFVKFALAKSISSVLQFSLDHPQLTLGVFAVALVSVVLFVIKSVVSMVYRLMVRTTKIFILFSIALLSYFVYQKGWEPVATELHQYSRAVYFYAKENQYKVQYWLTYLYRHALSYWNNADTDYLREHQDEVVSHYVSMLTDPTWFTYIANSLKVIVAAAWANVFKFITSIEKA